MWVAVYEHESEMTVIGPLRTREKAVWVTEYCNCEPFDADDGVWNVARLVSVAEAKKAMG